MEIGSIFLSVIQLVQHLLWRPSSRWFSIWPICWLFSVGSYDSIGATDNHDQWFFLLSSPHWGQLYVSAHKLQIWINREPQCFFNISKIPTLKWVLQGQVNASYSGEVLCLSEGLEGLAYPKVRSNGFSLLLNFGFKSLSCLKFLLQMVSNTAGPRKKKIA